MTTAAADAAPTPMMAQYIEIKAANPDCLLFYRMGDFYELFFEDAEEASRALGIALTKRGKHLGEDIPMCGVPIHAAEDYLQKLIALGHRIAVCDQMEDPAEAKKRGSKSVVKRDVVRLVTPGTITEDQLLEAGRANYLMTLTRLGAKGREGEFAMAWTDLSTGAFRLAETGPDRLEADIAAVEPSEVVVAEALYRDEAFAQVFRRLGRRGRPEVFLGSWPLGLLARGGQASGREDPAPFPGSNCRPPQRSSPMSARPSSPRAPLCSGPSAGSRAPPWKSIRRRAPRWN